ncbi:MAG: CoA-binding protein [Pseudomonadota bacterium]
MAFTNPSSEDIRTLLERVRRIAVVGLSPKTDRPSYKVASALQGFGYRIIPVRPMATEILGEKVYSDLASVPDHIDLVDVFRAPEQVDEVIDACIALRVPAVWLQDGVVNEAAAQRAHDAGLMVVMDRCVYRDYVLLFGVVPRSVP